jgi:NADH-quinone oxidoreductase subunit L
MSHSEEFMLMGISVAVALTSMIVAYVVYVSRKVVPVEDGVATSPVQRLIYNKYYVDEIYDAIIVKPLTVMSHVFHGVVEFLFIDLIVTLIGRFFIELGAVVRKMQTGTIGTYVMLMVAGIATLLFFNLLI